MTRTGKWGTKLTQNSPNLRGSCRVAIGLVGVLVVTAITSHPAQARHAAEPHHFRAHVMTHGHDYSPPYSAIVVDANSGNVLHSASPDEPRHPASLTKIMTLYLLFERLEAGKLKLDSQLSVSEHASVQAPTKLGLKPGQTIAVEDAIRGLVTKSANDAAVVVAEAIGGNESDFAEMMTKQAHALGMSRTVYRNASGLPNDEQLTTARDQAVLGRAIQERFPREYRYFSTPSFTYHGEAMRNHNRLLGQVEGVDGIKTGYTQASGFNLVTSVRRNNRHIVAVVLGGASAGARDARMRTLIEQHIAAASPQHTAPAIAEATGAKPATRAAEAQPGKASTYTVASFSPPAAWPASKFVPATPADPAPTATVAAPAAKSAATTPGIDAIKPQPKPAAAAAAAADANDTITPIRVKTVKVKLTQTHTAGLGPVAAAARDEPAPEAVAAPAPVAAPPPKVPAPAPKAVAIAPAAVAPAGCPHAGCCRAHHRSAGCRRCTGRPGPGYPGAGCCRASHRGTGCCRGAGRPGPGCPGAGCCHAGHRGPGCCRGTGRPGPGYPGAGCCHAGHRGPGCCRGAGRPGPGCTGARCCRTSHRGTGCCRCAGYPGSGCPGAGCCRASHRGPGCCRCTGRPSPGCSAAGCHCSHHGPNCCRRPGRAARHCHGGRAAHARSCRPRTQGRHCRAQRIDAHGLDRSGRRLRRRARRPAEAEQRSRQGRPCARQCRSLHRAGREGRQDTLSRPLRRLPAERRGRRRLQATKT